MLMINAIEIKKLNKSFLRNLPQGLRCFNLLYNFLINRQTLNVTKVSVLVDLNLSIGVGKIIGFNGANGSGKSTLLRIIAGIYTFDCGSVVVNGKTLYLSGYSVLVNKDLTILENFLYIPLIYGVSEESIRETSLSILDEVGLTEHLDRKTFTLSEGQKARLGFAISFFIIQNRNPDILILDEVFAGGGDVEFKQYSVNKIRQIIKGKTVLMVSHDENLLLRECDMFYQMKSGNLTPMNPCNK